MIAVNATFKHLKTVLRYHKVNDNLGDDQYEVNDGGTLPFQNASGNNWVPDLTPLIGWR